MHILRASFSVLIALAVLCAWAAPRVEDEAVLRQIKEVDWPKA